jgi:hypothetical protein
MAEHIGQHVEPELSGFNNMGKPIPTDRRQAAYEHCKEMGLNAARSWECVNGVAEQLERDKPYEAQAAGMKHLDLTGTYRLMAVLLTSVA